MLRCVWLIAFAIGCGNPSRATVDSNDGNGITPDAPAEPGQFGAPCTEHTDCDSGYCVEPVGEHGGVCTKTCDTDSCPQDWECHSVHLPQADVKLCVPAAKQLCLACANDTECGGGACLQIDGGGHCAIPCSGQCPTGYTCKADATNSHTGNWCQPVTDSCTCTAALAGAMRTCSKSGTVNGSAATCLGSQMCSATTGWSACTANTPAPETCDGVDNDCNFLIDDGVISGDPSCTNTNAAGSCPGTKQCNGSGIVCVGQTPATEKCNALDDNCNGAVDETFVAMGLGSACTAGVGACTRYGSQRCNSTQDGLVCSAVAASPTTELCNQIDDDCDSNVDENFKSTFSPPYPNPLGGPCTAGFGVCARGGSYVCATNGAGTVCSATADLSQMTTETCNYKDDNCDGVVDNGFKNTSTGFYDTDTNCGACGTDCTTMFTGGQAYGQCVVNTSPQCVMRCNNGYGNLNGSTLDGCEFQIDPTAIYVSVTDTTAADDATCGIGPTGTGTGNHPCKSINQGLLRAVQTSRTQVLVADGTYNEGVTLVSGKNLLGGYRADTWERHVATTSTVIAGSIPAGSHLRTVVASQIAAPTLFEGFVVRGAFNTNPSGNSYAVYVVFADSNLVIRNNQIFGGRGGTGSAGAAGLNGATGANGATYSSNTYDSFTTSGSTGCASSNNRAAYGGGVRTCATSDDVGGGNGGGNNCTPARSTQNSTATSPALAGQPGAGAGGGTAGAPGSRGYDADLYTNRCDLPTTSNGTLLSMFGTNGQPGGPGAPAPGVGGCSAATGSVVAYEWVGGSGNAGAIGSNGGGGGGGGAGGGATCTFCVITGMTAKDGPDLLGAHGGGGGSGGCGGAGGGSGNAGGGAFGIFVVGTSAPTLTTNSITLGTGGDGGAGGIGGGGGLGGTGTQGGDQGTASILFCTGKGGRGGDGGDGGPGSGGGGGCGGSSFGIFTSGVGTVGCGSNTVSGGSAGTGGAGGFSGGNSGGAGVNGVVQNCVSQ